MSAATHDLLETWSHRSEQEPSIGELAAIEDIDAAGWFELESPQPVQVTLLELVEAVSEVSDTESEVVGTVAYMLSSGSVELTGAFRNEPVRELFAAR